MGISWPEQPLLIYPSLVEAYGLEEGLLLSAFSGLAVLLGHTNTAGQRQLELSLEHWLGLVPFWDEEKLAMVTSSLVTQGAIDARFAAAGVSVTLLAPPREAPPAARPEAGEQPRGGTLAVEVEPVNRLPVVEEPPRMTPPLHQVRTRSSLPDAIGNRGPAPTFGGSIGWGRNRARQQDELHEIFKQHEVRNQQLHAIFVGWQPSETFFSLLPRHGIPEQFANDCIDEFVLYWLDKDRRESNWDQKFLGWVKREWVKKQTETARQQRQEQERQTGLKHEDTRTDTRAKRQRVTQAIMDIRDTDW